MESVQINDASNASSSMQLSLEPTPPLPLPLPLPCPLSLALIPSQSYPTRCYMALGPLLGSKGSCSLGIDCPATTCVPHSRPTSSSRGPYLPRVTAHEEAI